MLGYNLDIGLKPYVAKPTLLYKETNTDINANPFLLTDSVQIDTIKKYEEFNTVVRQSGLDYSLSWGAEVDERRGVVVSNSLYVKYWEAYIRNLFNKKQRLTTCDMYLPQSILTTLRLNDRLVIHDKLYIINTLKLNLTTGLASFELYEDFEMSNVFIDESPNPSPSQEREQPGGNES